MKAKKPKFQIGQVVRDMSTTGRYAIVTGMYDRYLHLRADTMDYDVPIVNVREDDIPEFPKYCPVFPCIKLEYRVGYGRSKGSVSIDRINNNIGYRPDNIRIISYLANHLKSWATDKELVALGKDAEKRLKKS